MNNLIESSNFRSKGTYTIITNPSVLVDTLMKGISIEDAEFLLDDTVAYYHRDIGTVEDMQKLFMALDSAC